MTNTEPLEQSILQLTGPGRNAALEVLYRALRREVYAVALGVLADRFLAEDAAEETFVRLVEAARRYRPRGQAKAYVLRIARNTAMELARQRRREQSTDPFPELEAAANATGIETALTCLAATQKLKQGEREVILLHYGAGLTFAECARILRLPEGTVKYRHTGALLHLRAQLESLTEGGVQDETKNRPSSDRAEQPERSCKANV